MKIPNIPKPLRLGLASGIIISIMTAMTHAAVRLPKIFSDHMVLQRDQPVAVWSWADPGKKINKKSLFWWYRHARNYQP